MSQEPYGLYSGISHYYRELHGWSTEEKCLMLAEYAVKTAGKVSVDLGAYGGRGAISMGMAHREQGIGVCHAVDAWDNAVTLLGEQDDANKDWWSKVPIAEIYTDFLTKLYAHRLEKFVTVHKMTSEAASKLFEDGSVNVLHLDANHSEELSTLDVKLWMPKMAKDSYIFFDDSAWTEKGKPSTLKAQNILLDNGWHVTHTAKPMTDWQGLHDEWKLFTNCPKIGAKA